MAYGTNFPTFEVNESVFAIFEQKMKSKHTVISGVSVELKTNVNKIADRLGVSVNSLMSIHAHKLARQYPPQDRMDVE